MTQTPAIDSYLEQQYNNRAAVPEHSQFFDSWNQRSEAYRQQAGAHLDIAYGESPRQSLDIFPVQQSVAPVHVFIHGGYWQALSRDAFSFMAQAFNQQGECAVILNYDLCPQVPLSTIIDQMHRALAWVVRHIGEYGGDPQRIQLTGHSAGGHLLACLLTQDWSELALEHPPLQRLNALSGLYDLQPLLTTGVNQALGLDTASAQAASPLFHPLWRPDPRCELNLYVGALESDEYKKQSQQLIDAWGNTLSMHYELLPDTHHFSILDRFLRTVYQPLA